MWCSVYVEKILRAIRFPNRTCKEIDNFPYFIRSFKTSLPVDYEQTVRKWYKKEYTECEFCPGRPSAGSPLRCIPYSYSESTVVLDTVPPVALYSPSLLSWPTLSIPLWFS